VPLLIVSALKTALPAGAFSVVLGLPPAEYFQYPIFGVVCTALPYGTRIRLPSIHERKAVCSTPFIGVVPRTVATDPLTDKRLTKTERGFLVFVQDSTVMWLPHPYVFRQRQETSRIDYRSCGSPELQ